MKAVLKRLLDRTGRVLLPSTPDPVLQDLLQAYCELRLRPSDAAYWQHRLSRVGALGHLRDLLRTHRIGCVLDVGANAGQFGSSLRRLGYSGRIISFEPMDQALQKVAADDGNWDVMPVALGRAHAEMDLQIFADDTFSSLHEVHGSAFSRFGKYLVKTGSQKVRVERLDDLWLSLFAGRPQCPVMLKTDTQGHDLEVLEGAEDSLKSTAVVLSEVSVERIYANSPAMVELVGHLEERGFRASGYYPYSHRLESLAMIELDAFFVRT